MESFRRRNLTISGIVVALLLGGGQIYGRLIGPDPRPENSASAQQAGAPAPQVDSMPAAQVTAGSEGTQAPPAEVPKNPGEVAPSKGPEFRNTLPIIFFVISVLVTMGLFGSTYMKLSQLTGAVATLKRMVRLHPDSGFAERPGHVGPIDEKGRAKEGPSQEDLDNLRQSLESSLDDKFNRANAALQIVMESQKTIRQKTDKAAADLDRIAALDQAVVILRNEQRGKYSELRNIIAELEKEIFSERNRPVRVEETMPITESYPSCPDEDVAPRFYELKNINPYTLQIAKLTEKYWAEIGGDLENLEKAAASRFVDWFNGLLEGLDRMEISGEAGDQSRYIEGRILPLIDAIDGFFRESEILASHAGIIRKFDTYLHRVLELYGIEEIRVEVLKNTFDGERHQLVKTVTHPGYPLGTIIEIQKRGFSFEGSILRKPWVIQSTS